MVAKMQTTIQRTYQIVVAATRDFGIAKDGKLPWKLPSDLNFFKEITTSTSSDHTDKMNAVIMGRKTWDSIPLQYRPLPNRLNVVLTRSTTFNIPTFENVITCSSIPSALELLAISPYSMSIDKVFVIGGGQILREVMNGSGCEAIHMTEIDENIDCDTFIPPVDTKVFCPWYSSLPVTENGVRYRFVSYVRCNCNLDSEKLKVEDFSFLPKMIFDKRSEISSGCCLK
ncbi:bifunctional dihydrofolate reductase-thymidylate synthase-like [Rutidosis leptorrhynchoides]|uniref:bifunctional dihydrofolate reductase-thymidylate synthase-like n=1 Tax=Rutidosis leptorrhynchoides TaxID=125765 RepID=UPI003A99A3BD